jgi:hypothetical protein
MTTKHSTSPFPCAQARHSDLVTHILLVVGLQEGVDASMSTLPPQASVEKSLRVQFLLGCREVIKVLVPII